MESKSTRDLRQEECVKNWKKYRCKGTLECCTGFGKTRCALIAIKAFLEKNPTASIKVIVPSAQLKAQWEGLLISNGIIFVEVFVVNTAIKLLLCCDLLVIDEIHVLGAPSFSKIFETVKYKVILGLTATLERLDGKHELINKYCPVCDSVPLELAVQEGWVSNYKKYKVLLDVDLTEYNAANTEFYNHFAFFNYNFNLAMSCIGPQGYLMREKLVKELTNDPSKYKELRQVITAHAFGFMKALQARKAFIANHPKKIEITNYILEHRNDSKAITFSPTIKVAEKIKYGGVLHSKQTKKKRSMTLDEFCSVKSGVLNSSKAINTGTDIPGVNLGIILGINSSKTTLVQTTGRIIRFEEGKEAEIFILVINGTVETEWFKKANGVSSYINIDEEGLEKVLNNELYTPKKEKSTGMLFRW